MSDETFNILVLSDFHYKHDDKDKFEAVFNPFLECLKKLLEEQNGWEPHCVALVGDIVHCDGVKSLYDYAYMAERMHDIRRVLGGKIPIIAVPGNHDKNVSQESKDGLDGEYVENFWAQYCGQKKPDNLNLIQSFLEKYFGQYASFVSNYHVASNWHPMPELGLSGDEAKLEKISGYYILEEPEVCVIILNTEWRYGGADKSSMTIGKRIVEKMAPIAEDYRDKGYFIITLMHREPGSLQWEDRYSENLDKPSPMERMTRVSDLIICAHEHVVREVPPDILMDSAILYRNGCMFTNNKESAEHYPFSASLLKIDKKNRLLLSRKIRCESVEFGKVAWGASPIKTYCWQHRETPVIAPAKRINRIYKEIWMQYPLDKHMLEEKILSLYFPDGRAPDFMHVVCCLFEDEAKAKETAWQEMMRVKDKTLTLLFYAKLYSWSEENLRKLIVKYKAVQKALQVQANENGLEAVFNLVLCKMLG